MKEENKIHGNKDEKNRNNSNLKYERKVMKKENSKKKLFLLVDKSSNKSHDEDLTYDIYLVNGLKYPKNYAHIFRRVTSGAVPV